MKMNKKICVYAICKNEFKFIDSWLASMSEADYIVVLDTGSTDGTYEKLKADKRVTRVEQKIFNPWRFDTPRNESMKLAPDDADILVCTDFDEVFEPGWADVVRKTWQEDTTVIRYLYAWNHTEQGEPLTTAIYMKIHTRDYHWIFPVHEMLVPIREDFQEKGIDVLDGSIYLHHWQDLSKPRKYYFDLLELGVKEFPENAYMRSFLGREYFFHGDYEKGIEQYKIAMTLPDMYDKKKELIYLDALLYMTGGYEELKQYDNAIECCYKFLEYDFSFRDPYFFLSELYNLKGLYTVAEAFAKAGFEYGYDHHTFVEKYRANLGWGYEALGLAQLNLGKKEEAEKNFRIALSYRPDNEDIKEWLRLSQIK